LQNFKLTPFTVLLLVSFSLLLLGAFSIEPLLLLFFIFLIAQFLVVAFQILPLLIFLSSLFQLIATLLL